MESFEQARPDMPTVELTVRGRPLRFTRRGNVMKYATWMDAPATTIVHCPECQERIQIGSFRPMLDLTESSLELLEAMIEPDDRAAWEAIRDDDEYPLEPKHLQQMVLRVLELTTARPTERPSGSSSTESETGTRSTANSDSPVAV
jgi:hypothetical protein